MNKTYLIGGVVVIGAIAAYFAFGGKAPTDAPAAPTTETPAAQEKMDTTSMKMRHTLRELMSMGSAMKCTFRSGEGEVGMRGVSYLAGGKVRTDSTIEARGPEQVSSIIDGEYMYTWGSRMPEGMKMKMSALESVAQNQNTPTTPSEKMTDLDAATDYDCTSWSVDMSVFVPPANIEFVDYSEMMNSMQGMMRGMGTDAGMMEGMEPYLGE